VTSQAYTSTIREIAGEFLEPNHLGLGHSVCAGKKSDITLKKDGQ
jgi:hypothetical protein